MSLEWGWAWKLVKDVDLEWGWKMQRIEDGK
jgi:hypothetical protein